MSAPPASASAGATTGTTRYGLSSVQAAERLYRDGGNTLPIGKPTPLWRRVLAQLRDPLVLVLLVAAALTIVTGDWTDAIVILAVITINTAVGVAQEVKADRAITALQVMAAPHARVLREGVQRQIPTAEVVVGDLIVLAEGDIIPADAAVIDAAALRVDESALTGESVPVDKSCDQLADDDARSAVASGTVVVHGRGLAVVTATGGRSAMGRIAASMSTSSGLTPLQHRLVGVGRALAAAAVVLSAIVLALGLWRGQPVELMVVTTISLVVAAVPESLPAVVTLALALGARRMAARHALIRRLPAVETLGSVTVLATDKTGTLTEGRMVARALWTPVGDAAIGGAIDRPDGDISRDGHTITADTAVDVAELLIDVALCNDATMHRSEADGRWESLGDPTETALLIAAGKLRHVDVTGDWQRITELPFDSRRKRMSTAHRSADGTVRVVCKGAPEAVLTSGVLTDDVDLVRAALARAERFAEDGYRVLAVAHLDQSDLPNLESLEHGLRLVGLIAIADPPRASATSTIAACRAAGITPVLITGDHPATARAIAIATGVLDASATDVVDCRTVSDADATVWREGRVFARATPEQKLAIIQAHRDAGEIVAMTGDGVNDGPALRRADIGVAMGRRGTEVARQAADLVLADDELGTVVAAAEEGRRVYTNIRRFLLYALAGGTAEIVVMLAGPFVGLPLTLLPAQLLWVNLLTHGLPGVALGSEPVEPGTMSHPPRPPAESVLGAGLWQRVLRVGVVISGVTLGIAVWADHTGRPWQSLAFFTLGATQLAVAIGSRARPGTRTNPMLLVAVAGAFSLQLAGLYLPVLQTFLHTEAIAPADLAVATALACLGYAAIRLDRIIHRPPTRSGPTAGPTETPPRSIERITPCPIASAQITDTAAERAAPSKTEIPHDTR